MFSLWSWVKARFVFLFLINKENKEESPNSRNIMLHRYYVWNIPWQCSAHAPVWFGLPQADLWLTLSAPDLLPVSWPRPLVGGQPPQPCPIGSPNRKRWFYWPTSSVAVSHWTGGPTVKIISLYGRPDETWVENLFAEIIIYHPKPFTIQNMLK